MIYFVDWTSFKGLLTIIIQIFMQRLGKAKAPSKTNKAKDIDEETLNELKEAFKIFDSKNTGNSS